MAIAPMSADQSAAAWAGAAAGAAEAYVDAQLNAEVDANEHTKADHVRKTVDARLEHEGDAAFENARIREEILAATGIDIGIAGRNADGPYLDIYEDFKNGMMSEAEARRQMGELQGEELEYRPSTTKREAYTAEAMSDYEKERNAP